MRLLITGASGKLGLYLLSELAALPWEVTATSRRPPLDWGGTFHASDLEALPDDLDGLQPDVILHCGALSVTTDCFRDPDLADRLNHQVPARLARWCAEHGRRLVHVSTDMVFDGEKAPYAEDAPTHPVSVYGHSKARGEEAILAWNCPSLAVVRVALMVGPALGPNRSYHDTLVDTLRSGKPMTLFEDEWRSCLSYQDAARGLLHLCRRPAHGVFHLGGERLSRLDFGRLVAEAMGCSQLLSAGRRSELVSPEPRPADLSMTCQRLHQHIPDWRPRRVEEQISGWLT